MVSLANILLSVSTELVMVPTAYLTLAPMRFSEWISGKAFAFLMALSVVGGVGCGVVYALVPSVRLALFVSSSLVSLLILVRVSRIRLRSILYIFFTAEFFICSVRILAGIASFCLRPSSYQGGVPSWEAHVIMWALLILFTLVFRPVFIERISFIIENCESGRAPDTLWRFGWLLPFSCYLVVVLALDTAPDQIASVSQLALTLFLQVVLLLLYYTIVDFEYRLMRSARDVEENLNRQHLLSLQLQQNSIMKDRIEQARRARHDLRHFRGVVGMYAREGDLDGLVEYLGELDAISDDDPLVWCENQVVNAIVGHYVSKARALGADVKVEASVPEDLPLSEIALTTVVGNVLENAVTALEHAKGEGDVRLAMSVVISVRDNSQFTLDVKNTYAGKILRNGQGRLLSTKHEGVGVGTASVIALAEQAGGFARFGSEGGLFRSFVLLPLS